MTCRTVVVVLTALGVAWIGRGLSLLHDPGLNRPADAILHNHLPVSTRVVLWCLTGAVAAVMVLIWSRTANELALAVGWGSLLILPAERAVSHAWSLVVWVVPDPWWELIGGVGVGTPYSAAYLVYWVGIGVAIYRLSGMRRATPAVPHG